MNINIKTITTHTLIGFVCLIIGMVSKTFFTWDMYNIYKDEGGYILELSLKNPKGLLIFNTPKQIEARVDYGMADLMIDLAAPPILKELLNNINMEKNWKKKLLIEKYRKYMDKGEKKINYVTVKEGKNENFQQDNVLCYNGSNLMYWMGHIHQDNTIGDYVPLRNHPDSTLCLGGVFPCKDIRSYHKSSKEEGI